MKVFVTGASGFLGSHVVERLLRSGHAVTALVRPATKLPSWADRVTLCRMDLLAADGLAAVLKSTDVVVHLAAVTTGSEDLQISQTIGGTEKLIAAMTEASVKRLVHISSLVVYDWHRVSRSMDENSPLAAYIDSMGGYAIAKYRQEMIISRFAEKTGCKTTILRPGFIWGKDHAEIAGMGRKIGPVFLVFGPGNPLPLTHVLNSADCVVTALEARDTSNDVIEIYNVFDTEPTTAWHYVGEYIRHSRLKCIRLAVPYLAGYAVASLATSVSHRLLGNKVQLPSFLTKRRFEAQFKPLQFSTEKLQKVLRWASPMDFKSCIRATYDE
jgi:UDP-glucose 4-epimerase